jgi:tetratricopeptide (TPR) repeat protein
MEAESAPHWAFSTLGLRFQAPDRKQTRFAGVRPMTAMTSQKRQAILRQAAGYLELGELLVNGTEPPPATARKLLLRSLDTLRELPEQARSGPAASLLEGEALRALDDWEAALPPLTRAADADASRTEAWLGIGWCLKRLGRLAEAIGALNRGLEASPHEPILLYNLACYHSLAGNVPAAIEHLTKAISIDDRFRDLTGMERDFDPIRSDPRFVAATHLTV